jgi:hypothetical protein
MTKTPDRKQSLKEQREAQRAEKVAAYQREQAAHRRNRRIGIASAIVGGAAVLGLITTFVVTGARSERPQDIAIPGLQEFPGITANHIDPNPVDYEAQYGMNPPAGGDHSQFWLNCGVYEEPQPDENAVHSLEHGAVWVTYDPESTTEAEVDALRNAIPNTYTILSPYPGLPSPIVASAWGAQIALDGTDDERLGRFIDKYWKSPSAPEPGASCTGALEGSGRVA